MASDWDDELTEHQMKQGRQIKKLKAERDKYKKGLESIANYDDNCCCGENGKTPVCEIMKNIAKRTLEVGMSE